jgi:NADH-quinone oxidoreductase subunit J
VFSILGLAGGIGLLLNRNPVHAALSLIVNFFSIAGLYLSLQAEFLAVIQVLVYAGAIMVLFLFVIMLLNLSVEAKQPYSTLRIAAFVVGIAFIAEMLIVFRQALPATGESFLKGDFMFSSAEAVGALLMTRYLFPFEMISAILLAALVGAIVIAKKFEYENKHNNN